jgi:hypothetical protein
MIEGKAPSTPDNAVQARRLTRPGGAHRRARETSTSWPENAVIPGADRQIRGKLFHAGYAHLPPRHGAWGSHPQINHETCRYMPIYLILLLIILIFW